VELYLVFLLGDITVSAESVYKEYGSIVALRGVTLKVGPGEIYGLVGPNGSGKTTLLRILAGIVKPTRGVVKIYGYDPYREFEETRKYIGYLPEDANTYDLLSGYEHLKLYAKIYGLSRDAVKYGAELSQLGERLRDHASTYSRGMKRRLLLALVLMRRPMIALLDEPTSGLDVYASVAVRNTIRKYTQETGATVIVSSHNMLEIEYLCTRVGLIYKGVIVDEGSPRELVVKHGASNLEEAFVKAIGEYRSEYQ
jgi:ABC-2 type transport system ATP-binding protein